MRWVISDLYIKAGLISTPAHPSWPVPCPLARPWRVGRAGAGGEGDLALGGGRGVPWPGSVIPDFTLPDTLEKNFVRDLASNFSK